MFWVFVHVLDMQTQGKYVDWWFGALLIKERIKVGPKPANMVRS